MNDTNTLPIFKQEVSDLLDRLAIDDEDRKKLTEAFDNLLSDLTEEGK